MTEEKSEKQRALLRVDRQEVMDLLAERHHAEMREQFLDGIATLFRCGPLFGFASFDSFIEEVTGRVRVQRTIAESAQLVKQMLGIDPEAVLGELQLPPETVKQLADMITTNARGDGYEAPNDGEEKPGTYL